METEKKIIQEILAGVDRYENLVKTYHIGLIIHCEHLVGDRDDAEDIAQEAFVKAYLKLDKFDSDRARFSTWLYRIATNEAIDFIRSRKRDVKVEDIELLAEHTMPTFIEDERRREVMSAVEKLHPPEFSEAIKAYYWKGYSYQEIAEEQGVPVNTVRSRLRRAKLQLKEQMK